jgi:hypothetical protein
MVKWLGEKTELSTIERGSTLLLGNDKEFSKVSFACRISHVASTRTKGGVRIPGHNDILEKRSELLERKEQTVSCLSMYSSWMDV